MDDNPSMKAVSKFGPGDKRESLSGWGNSTSGIVKGAVMGSPNATDSRLVGLLELVSARYQKWHGQKLRPTRKRRLKALDRQQLSAAGWAFRAVEIFRDLQEREVRRHVRIYAEVARTKRCPEMFGSALLGKLRNSLVESIGGSCQHLRARIEIRVMGGVDVTAAPLPGQEHYRQLQSHALDVINDELRVLEAESLADTKQDIARGNKGELTKGLRYHRRKAGLTQVELAATVGGNFAPETVSRYERNVLGASRAALEELVTAFRRKNYSVTVEDLLHNPPT